MDTKSAIQAMLDGNKVRKTHWFSTMFCWFDGSRFIDEFGRVIYYLGGDDWELYEKQITKQTVVIEKWLFEDRFGIKFIQDIEKDCVLCYCHEFQTTKVKLIDTYEVTL